MSFSFVSLHHLLEKAFKKRLLKAAGRNFLGRICVFHQGGGPFKLYRVVDFQRRLNTYGRVISITKDPSRSAFVARILYVNGIVSSIISVEGLILGALLFSGGFLPRKSLVPFSLGSAIPLRYINLFSVISTAELAPYQGLSLFRSAGVSAILISKDSRFGIVKCSSG